MERPDHIGSARIQLRDAILEFQTPPSNSLLISPWVGMSLLQKAIRRGRKELALRAAATLLTGSPERLWRRVACIAFEDVGLADFEAVALVTAAMAGKKFRASLGGNGQQPAFSSKGWQTRPNAGPMTTSCSQLRYYGSSRCEGRSAS